MTVGLDCSHSRCLDLYLEVFGSMAVPDIHCLGTAAVMDQHGASLLWEVDPQDQICQLAGFFSFSNVNALASLHSHAKTAVQADDQRCVSTAVKVQAGYIAWLYTTTGEYSPSSMRDQLLEKATNPLSTQRLF
jgi:hypothetical protein